jgi:hypothetical protein
LTGGVSEMWMVAIEPGTPDVHATPFHMKVGPEGA